MNRLDDWITKHPRTLAWVAFCTTLNLIFNLLHYA